MQSSAQSATLSTTADQAGFTAVTDLMAPVGEPHPVRRDADDKDTRVVPHVAQIGEALGEELLPALALAAAGDLGGPDDLDAAHRNREAVVDDQGDLRVLADALMLHIVAKD